ncbi:mannitol dehydrogenase family protein [Rhizobium ruizarguesonis]|jgi:mannitol 2-dehydrogenase|uniref:Mannitol dehydrogenase family protein n=1 Tax=Rhizobium ruizarguesonis TaxID=2081791 RepID=A0AAE4YYT9_9HYPH|nr:MULTISPECIES: mannitol dehydrogenase family protein [Rhizobium]MBY5805329.1 mannitol dehydrogenase family protein [Rhizobium leguminosarum]NKJ76899.1 mannitol dehydrogenase family protein [Rhizobium leguminosarum bv. viciae]QIO46220.1 mannitol dehydrogenase family protein [Rhizobium leguminosarum bv. trifolii]QJS29456.1 mannitol dehydrogenase family protein [Rhizobium leguminosarum bv. trifolii TA1]MBY5830434.1 mannitol dehydrogenase family protein [Rhizobium leguminosarum]
MTCKLSLATLSDVARTAAIPGYDRASLKAGIVHFGVGNFHRAHQAIYLDDLFNAGTDHDWAIVGAGVLPSDAAMREKLAAQDFLTTVVEQDNNKTAARVTAPMIDILPVGDATAIIAKLADPEIRIVSMTITEGGYFIDASGTFNPTHPAIAADGQNPNAPKTVFGLIVAGLKARKDKGIGPFTVMSCDNIPHNGVVTANAVVGTAALSDPAFADWIRANVAFPNGMVDRITPATSQREVDFLRDNFQIEDSWPVYCEEFKQWVLEDKFTAGRPALEKVGVTFVPDVTPYEHMKIRILNGGHAAIAYPAALMDIHFVHDSMEDPLIRAFLAKLEKDEIIPIVPPVPNTSLADYFALIEHRLLNPKIADTIPRLAQDGSNRQPKFILPSTLDNLRQGRDVVGLALVSALWCRYFAGKTDSGKDIVFNDASAERLHAAALKAKDDPSAFLVFDDIFGEVAKSELFRKRFAHALKTLWEKGTRETLQLYLDGKLAV